MVSLSTHLSARFSADAGISSRPGTVRLLVLAGLVFGGAHLLACASVDGRQDAVNLVAEDPRSALSIVGDHEIILEPGLPTELTVQYETSNLDGGSGSGAGRIGTVYFDIIGTTTSAFGAEGKGGTKTQTQTTAAGLARTMLLGSPTIGESFQVQVSAPGAQDVSYRVTIGYPELAGHYDLTTHLAINRALDGFWGGMMNTFSAISKGPMSWFFRDVLGTRPSGNVFIDIALNTVMSIVDSFLEPFIPEVIHQAGEVADRFTNAIATLKVDSTFEVVRDAESKLSVKPYVGNHTFRAIHTNVDGEEVRLDHTDIGSVRPEDFGRAVGLEYHYERNFLEIDSHEIPVPYGAVLNQTMAVALQQTTGNAFKNMGELFKHHIKCDSFAARMIQGPEIADRIKRGLLEGVCNAGLNFISDRITASMGSPNIVAVLEVDGRTQRGRFSRGGFWRGHIAHSSAQVEIGGSAASGQARFEARERDTRAPTTDSRGGDVGATPTSLGGISAAPLLPTNPTGSSTATIPSL